MIISIEEKKKILEQKKQQLLLREKILKEKEKKKRIQRLNEIGKIAYKANIDLLDHKILLGAFIEVAEKSKEKMVLENWALIADKYTQLQNSKPQALAIMFKGEIRVEIKEQLKLLGFKWCRFRKEFQGNGNRSYIESLLKNCEFQIQEF